MKRQQFVGTAYEGSWSQRVKVRPKATKCTLVYAETVGDTCAVNCCYV